MKRIMEYEFLENVVEFLSRNSISSQEVSQCFYLLAEIAKADHNLRDRVIRSKVFNEAMKLANNCKGVDHFTHAFCTLAEAMLVPIGV